jgi:hypothetical protein
MLEDDLQGREAPGLPKDLNDIVFEGTKIKSIL